MTTPIWLNAARTGAGLSMSDGACDRSALNCGIVDATLPSMPPSQFQKGLEVILTAITQGLSDRGLQSVAVAHDFSGVDERSVVYSLKDSNRQMAETFSRDEIIDSGEAIDAPSAQKVRTLVSHFIPQNSAPR